MLTGANTFSSTVSRIRRIFVTTLKAIAHRQLPVPEIYTRPKTVLLTTTNLRKIHAMHPDQQEPQQNVVNMDAEPATVVLHRDNEIPPEVSFNDVIVEFQQEEVPGTYLNPTATDVDITSYGEVAIQPFLRQHNPWSFTEFDHNHAVDAPVHHQEQPGETVPPEENARGSQETSESTVLRRNSEESSVDYARIIEFQQEVVVSAAVLNPAPATVNTNSDELTVEQFLLHQEHDHLSANAIDNEQTDVQVASFVHPYRQETEENVTGYRTTTVAQDNVTTHQGSSEVFSTIQHTSEEIAVDHIVQVGVQDSSLVYVQPPEQETFGDVIVAYGTSSPYAIKRKEVVVVEQEEDVITREPKKQCTFDDVPIGATTGSKATKRIQGSIGLEELGDESNFSISTPREKKTKFTNSADSD